MRDPLTWSFPIGRLFGITIRIHLLFIIVAAGIILREGFMQEGAQPGDWIITAGIIGLLFLSVLLHEFGHCFGARWVDGDAREILLWPLGGLAYVEVPQTPRANLITVLAGPLVNLLLCVAAGAVLGAIGVRPPLWPGWYTHHDPAFAELPAWYYWLARFFFVNWMLFWFNMLLVGFPMDAGRILQCVLWPRLGYRAATEWAVYAGFVSAIVLAVIAIGLSSADGVLIFGLALFIYFTCRQQYMLLEQGADESFLGYDFSQGYTSLEREQAASRPNRPGAIHRWLQRRAARKQQREAQQREAEERRMDELLEKVQRNGLHSLNDEERRFLTRVSAKYRNKR